MPYEYRRLTPQERDLVLNQRRELGYPLHAPPHPFRDAGRYLISAANFEHVPMMASPDRRTDFESRLLAMMDDIHAEVYAWSVLPNHYQSYLALIPWIRCRPRSNSFTERHRESGTWLMGRLGNAVCGTSLPIG